MSISKVGDTIEITADNSFKGMRFTVVECPENRRDSVTHDWAWVEYEGTILSVPNDSYKVVGKTKNEQSDSVDEFLRRQTNDNLGSVFA